MALTPEEQAAASAAWLAANRPDLVNTQNTAEQAAALNLQWRAVNAPGTITPSELQQANIYRQQFQQQQQTLFNQQSAAQYADAMDAYRETMKHNIAFNPGSVDPSQVPEDMQGFYQRNMTQATHEYYMKNPSPEFQAINAEYNASRNRVVGSEGVMYQGKVTPSADQNPFPEDSALGIAWLVARTGGGSDSYLNEIAKAEGKQVGVDISWIRYATDIYVERPYFPREVLTTKTGEQFVNPEWNGVPIRLNLTEAEMAAGLPTGDFKNFYRYSDESRRLEAVTSPTINIDVGVHKAPMDYGGPLLQNGMYGGWTRNGGVSDRLIGGGKVAGDFQMVNSNAGSVGSWMQGAFGAATSQAPTSVLRPSDFDLFIMGANIPFAREIAQVSDFWFGGREMQTTTKGPVKYGTPSITEGSSVTEYSEPITTKESIPGGWLFTTTAAATTTTNKTINTPVMQDITTTSVPVKSGFDFWLGGFEDKIRSLIPAPEVGEQAVKFASLSNIFTGPQIIGGEIVKRGSESIFGVESDIAKSAKESAETAYLMNPAGLSGQYTTFYEHPTMSAINYAIGAGFGGLAAGAEKVYMAGRGIMAEKAIASGGAYRFAEQGGGVVMKWAPVLLGGVYAADIAGRSTKGFTDFEPTRVMPSARGLILQEAVPMAAGFNALPNLAKSVALSDLAYKSELQLGQTTGRFDYYIKQPIRESVRPIQNDFLSYRADFQADQPKAFIKQDVGITDYIAYRANRAYQLNIAQPIDAFAQEAPGKIAGAYENVYSKYFNTKLEASILPERVANRVSNAAIDLRSDYLEYYVRQEAASALTPRQQIDKSLLETMYPKTGYLRRERVAIYNADTGELISTNPGSWRDNEGNWMSSVGINKDAMISGMRKQGIEPFTERIDIEGARTVVPDYVDAIRFEVYHTHPLGVERAPVELRGFMERPSGQDYIVTKSHGKSSVLEGVVTPNGIISYDTKLNVSKLTRLAPQAKRISFLTGYFEENPVAAGKSYESLMNRYGGYTKDWYRYRTVDQVRASLPTEAPPSILGYIGEKAEQSATINRFANILSGERGITNPIEAITTPAKVEQELFKTYVRPENEYAFQYTRTTPSEKFDAFVDFLYSPKLSRIITPSTYGETKFVPFPTVTGTRGPAEGTRTTRPGEPSAPKYRRTVIGGVERVGLAKEPSLASMGIKEITDTGNPAPGETPVKSWRSTDYRGKPASSTMKPLWESGGKQATGVSLLTEELPMAEGMTEGMHMPNVNVWAVIPVPRFTRESQTEIIQVLSPETTFMQESQTEQQRSVFSITAQMQMPGQVSGIESRYGQDILQEIRQSQKERQFITEASRVNSVTPLRSPVRDTKIDTRTIYDIEQDERQNVVPMTKTIFDQITNQRIRQDQITDTRQDLIDTPWQDTWQYTEETPWIIKTPPPLPWGGGGGGGGAKNPWRRAAVELLYIGPRSIARPAVRMSKKTVRKKK